MVTRNKRTAAEQKFWDAAFLAIFSECINQLELKGAEGCAQLAKQAANAALKERRESQQSH